MTTRLLPEPTHEWLYMYPDGSHIERSIDRPGKWYALPPVGVERQGDSHWHDTPEEAARWLTSLGVGPTSLGGDACAS